VFDYYLTPPAVCSARIIPLFIIHSNPLTKSSSEIIPSENHFALFFIQSGTAGLFSDDGILFTPSSFIAISAASDLQMMGFFLLPLPLLLFRRHQIYQVLQDHMLL